MLKNILTVTLLCTIAQCHTMALPQKDTIQEHRAIDQQLLIAVDNGDDTEVKLLLAQGANANCLDNDGDTVLQKAADRGYYAIILSLILYGADVNAKTQNEASITPLHGAACYGHNEAAKLLIECGANVHAKGVLDIMPLHFAENTDIATVLIDNGANIEAEDHRGWKPLHYAVHFYRPDVVRLLLAKGARPDSRNMLGQTPFQLAVERKYNEIVELLGEYQAYNSDSQEKQATNKDQLSPNENCVKTIIEDHTEIIVGPLGAHISKPDTSERNKNIIALRNRIEEITSAGKILTFDEMCEFDI